jgi:hypothetical protein
MPCNVVHGLHTEDGGIKVLLNFGILQQHYTASQSRKPRLKCVLKPFHVTPASFGVNLFGA